MIHLKQISLTRLFVLVVLTQIGVHVLSIPYEESRKSGYDAWISVLVGGAIAQAAILIIYALGKNYADQPFPRYLSSIVGKPLASILNILLAVYFLESSLLVTVSYTDVINRWVLFTTPWFVIFGFMLFIAAYIASSSLRSLAVVSQTIMVMFLIGCAIVIFSGGLEEGDFRHFLPIGAHGAGSIMLDSFRAFWAYAGYELLLYVFPYVKYRKKRDVLIALSAANGVTTLFYLLISVIVLYSLSENQLRFVPEPMVFILRQFKWPVVQNLDILFMMLWLSVTLVTAYVYLFMAARYLAFVGTKEIQKHTLLVWILAFLCFAAGFWGSDRHRMLQFANYHNTSTAIAIVLIPTILLIVSRIRRGR
ncbi:GerAB/ArcD/ProY family transporter [Paenibacillus aurantius]|uniref:GerAB/ArcD/ProY family transporter n=1 Tax=Paenibacillus aurantius TaxID=2918900 RepID=A0AA96RGZ4_9BACL|nr:GerAB/ArcD/ProY family transporter [Paenibacillus aurantius]WNQ12823.1 GerAB/ArcD/ProY family transporter [Paenibacillus aurantius]